MAEYHVINASKGGRACVAKRHAVLIDGVVSMLSGPVYMSYIAWSKGERPHLATVAGKSQCPQRSG